MRVGCNDTFARTATKVRRTRPFCSTCRPICYPALKQELWIPLIAAAAFGRRAAGLHPTFAVAGQPVVLATHLIAAIRAGQLGPAMASLSDRRDEIVRALDILLAGV
ncbi:MAG: CcdB family protein [Rhodospirillales bacterium]